MKREKILKDIKNSLGDKIKNFYEKSPRRVYIDIAPKHLRESARFLFRTLGARFNIASAIDRPDGTEILYHFDFDRVGMIVTLRVFSGERQGATFDSITPVFPGAEWIEREMHELFGIDFKGHPNLTRLLLPDEWPDYNYPLRKDYTHES
jgi:NADH:ubiquinone oxidoreductase subunit C